MEDMEDAINKHGGWEGEKAKNVWEQFKINAFNTLNRLTKQKKNEIRRSSHHYHLTGLQLRLRHSLEKEESPSIERYKRIEKIKEEIREEWKKIRPATGQNAFSRFQQEEVMSKQFFRKFKNKNANANIGELRLVYDWDNPEDGESATTQADDEIAKEATKYYRWLYQKKHTATEATEKMIGI